MKDPCFQFADPALLPRAKEVLQLDHGAVCHGPTLHGRRNPHKSGCEGWSVAWAPDKSYLAWSAGHRIVQLVPWNDKHQRKHDPNDAEGLRGRRYHLIDCGELVHSLAFGHSSTHFHKQSWKLQTFDKTLVLATGHPSGRIKLWNCESGLLLCELLDHKEIVGCLHFAQDNSLRLASAAKDGFVKLWEFDKQGDCNLYLTLKTNTKHAFCCRWSPDMKHMAVTGSLKTALLFQIEGRHVEKRVQLEGHHHDVVSCDFSPDGALLATASRDTRVIIWDVYTQSILFELGHLHPSPRPIYAGGANDHYLYSVEFAPDGTRLASVGEDGYVRVWHMRDLSDPSLIAQVDGALCSYFSADGQLLAVGCNHGGAVVLATPHPPSTLMHICRCAVRTHVATQDIPALPVPNRLQEYLTYKAND